MAAEKTEILLIGPPKPVIVNGLDPAVNLIRFADAKDKDQLCAELAPRLRAIAMSVTSDRMDGAFMSRFPKLEIVSSFGVGYDHIEIPWAVAHGVTVTNTPDVLTEEVADTALGLLLCTVRELPGTSEVPGAAGCVGAPGGHPAGGTRNVELGQFGGRVGALGLLGLQPIRTGVERVG